MSRDTKDLVDDWTIDPWDDPDEVPAYQLESYRARGRAWRWIFVAVSMVVITLVLVVGGLALWFVRQVNPPGQPGEAVAIVVDQGASIATVSDLLQEKGVISNATVFRWYVARGHPLNLHPGTFTVHKKDSLGDIVKVLNTVPTQVYEKVAIPEGLNLNEVADRLVKQIPRLNVQKFLATAKSGTVQSRWAEAGTTNFEGLLFPDTYQIAQDETEEQIFARMVKLMDTVGARAGLERAPQTVGYSAFEVLTIASIIEKEAKVPGDRAKIARVIYNRLEKKMPLEIDATVIYASGGVVRKVTSDLIDKTDSPWNTYKYGGLPPTPIAMPGNASIEAAMSPAQGDWFYYVLTGKDGSHTFAKTYEEHLANIEIGKKNGVL
ncbi:MAG: endolytic transglycosylase MltG [Acidimicrobiia bacterium]